jgi:hypothetical protein
MDSLQLPQASLEGVLLITADQQMAQYQAEVHFNDSDFSRFPGSAGAIRFNNTLIRNPP